MMQVRLAENFRALFYAPFYATQALAFYRQEGVELVFSASAAPGDAIAALVRGELDLTWAGPMRVIRDRAENPLTGTSLVCFCEVVRRDPFYLVGRADRRDFQLPDLASLRLGSVSEVVTPWLCLQQDLRDAGVDPDSVKRVADQSMQANLEALLQDRLDVAQLFEPYVSQALAGGQAHILHAASDRGPTAYTSLIATRDGVARNAAAMQAMVRATARMQAWMATHDAYELAGVAAPYFPQVERRLFDESIRRYALAGIWASDPGISRQGFTRLAQSVYSGGLVDKLVAYDECVAQL